ncbi:MAG: hypothetical protein GYA02_10390 [Clostridiaceae bacterium]|jgi:hypothetical protein|nr:hypothetical protein [Clostridiaceae bacterium]
MVHFRKHGFYERYYYSTEYKGKIVIRRYICPLCGCTISYIPHFCLPGFINAVKHIFEYIYNSFYREGSINSVIEQLNLKYDLQFSRQILYYYRKKFIKNIDTIQNGIRQIIKGVKLPDKTLEDVEKARNVLAIVISEYLDIHLFSQKYYQATTKTFLATTKSTN